MPLCKHCAKAEADPDSPGWLGLLPRCTTQPALQRGATPRSGGGGICRSRGA